MQLQAVQHIKYERRNGSSQLYCHMIWCWSFDLGIQETVSFCISLSCQSRASFARIFCKRNFPSAYRFCRSSLDEIFLEWQQISIPTANGRHVQAKSQWDIEMDGSRVKSPGKFLMKCILLWLRMPLPTLFKNFLGRRIPS